MKLLHVVPTYVPAWSHGGPIFAVHGLCRALAARGHDVTVFTTDVHGAGTLDVPLGEEVRLDGVKVFYFHVVQPRRLYPAPALRRALHERIAEFDLAHLHSLFLWPTAATARAARQRGVPYIVSPRGMLVADLLRGRGQLRKALWIQLVEKRNLRNAALLHATSELEAKEATRLGLDLPPVRVVPNGTDIEPPPGPNAEISEPVRRAISGGPFALYLGRLNWKKNLDALLAAIADVPGLRLVLGGASEEGTRERLEGVARERGLAERVSFAGEVLGDDKQALLHAASCLVLPSLSENFGNVVLEAMAAGRPVVATPGVGLAAEVRAAGAGLVVEGSAGALAAALRELLADPAHATAMGERGARLVRERFSWAVVATQMERLYAEALGSRAARASA